MTVQGTSSDLKSSNRPVSNSSTFVLKRMRLNACAISMHFLILSLTQVTRFRKVNNSITGQGLANK